MTVHDREAWGRRPRASHGTDSGYYRHVRARLSDAHLALPGWGPAPCDPCLAAHAAAEAHRATGRRARLADGITPQGVAAP